MKVLVLGAKGMLGQAIVKSWSDHEVVGLDLPDIDITKPLDIRRTFDLYRPQLLINCAAYTAVDQCETEEAKANLINGTAVGYLAKAADIQKIPIVHISTDYVFPGDKQDGYSEDDLPGPPVNAYGRTKLHGEEQLRLNTKRHYLIRTSWLYGPGGKNFVQTMLAIGKSPTTPVELSSTTPLQAGGDLKVVNDQHGKPTYTVDLSLFIKDLVLNRAPYGLYHGVNEQTTTWYVLAAETFRQAGLAVRVDPCATAEFPRPAKRPAWSTLLNTKRPLLRNWPDALRDYLNILGYPAGA